MNIEDDIKIINDGVTELSHYIAGAPHDAHYNYRLATLQVLQRIASALEKIQAYNVAPRQAAAATETANVGSASTSSGVSGNIHSLALATSQLSINTPTTSARREGRIDRAKNTNIRMFFTNIRYKKKCVVCNSSPTQLVAHYLDNHREVYISRLSAERRVALQSNGLFADKVKGVFKALCGICETTYVQAKEKWRKHLLTHTGEKMFYCEQCDEWTRLQQDHVAHTSKNIFTRENEILGVDGYICTICNYVQVQKSAVIRHLLTEHDETDGAKCQSIPLLCKPNTMSPRM